MKVNCTGIQVENELENYPKENAKQEFAGAM